MNPSHGSVGLAERDLDPGGGQVHPKVETANAVPEKKQPDPMSAAHGCPADPVDGHGVGCVAITREHQSDVQGDAPGLGAPPGSGLGETTIGEGGPTGEGLGEGLGLASGLGSCVGDGGGGVQFGVVPVRM